MPPWSGASETTAPRSPPRRARARRHRRAGAARRRRPRRPRASARRRPTRAPGRCRARGSARRRLRRCPAIEPAVEIANSRPAVRPSSSTEGAFSRTAMGETVPRIDALERRRGRSSRAAGSAAGPDPSRRACSSTQLVDERDREHEQRGRSEHRDEQPWDAGSGRRSRRRSSSRSRGRRGRHRSARPRRRASCRSTARARGSPRSRARAAPHRRGRRRPRSRSSYVGCAGRHGSSDTSTASTPARSSSSISG